ncbi:MAG TPA: YedE family putative selenium transporter [Syntrophomonadaceae bacterium]|nr:YedE-related selenium metabolism membrane protein [Syntrophomonadaceae bacterium]HOQ09153.1 YedE family putative selenium transporter [Syntrophomonadaceae bacterium]HPU48951.1 YedE family putative selenium transporter [Syntrophomonadaceae bacterium]
MDRSKWFILLAGLFIGAIAVVLVKLGNPPNMGFCIACFQRDIAGALGLHRAAAVQYVRPEIIGLLLGAMLTSMFAGEFKTRGGSATFVRFIMGVFMMIGALVFLGCPLRDILRMAGGDYNAVVGLLGFIAGVASGVFFLRRGFNLGRAEYSHSNVGGLLMPLFFVFLLFLLIKGTVFNPDAGGPLFFSKEGPGSMAAPVAISLAVGLIVGFLAQRTRLCMSGGIRDFILIRDNYLLLGFIGIFIGALILNIAFGFFKPGFNDQPIAHTMHIWNFLGLYLVGLTATLLGGCPLRQLIMTGEGDIDAAAVVAGMLVGAAFSHNFLFAASAAGVPTYGQIACVIGILVVAWIGWSYREA